MSQKKRNIIKRNINKRFIDLGRKAFTSNIYLRILLLLQRQQSSYRCQCDEEYVGFNLLNVNQQNPRENNGVIRSVCHIMMTPRYYFSRFVNTQSMDSAGAYILIENLNGVLQYANILSRLKGTNRNDNDQEEAVDFSEPINHPVDTLGYKIEMYQKQQHILRINQVRPFTLSCFTITINPTERHLFIDILMTILKYPIRVSVTISRDKKEIASQKSNYRELI